MIDQDITLTHASFLLPSNPKWSPLDTPFLHLDVIWRGCGITRHYYDGRLRTLHDDEMDRLLPNVTRYRQAAYTQHIVVAMKRYFPGALSLWFHPEEPYYELVCKVFKDDFGWCEAKTGIGTEKIDQGIHLNLQFFNADSKPLEVHGV